MNTQKYIDILNSHGWDPEVHLPVLKKCITPQKLRNSLENMEYYIGQNLSEIGLIEMTFTTIIVESRFKGYDVTFKTVEL